ncbi:hypothetical protein ACFS07_09450 [Undibacterium arcticum]
MLECQREPITYVNTQTGARSGQRRHHPYFDFIGTLRTPCRSKG